MSTASWFSGKVATLELCGTEDERGRLTPIDFAQLPFVPVRGFLISAPSGACRGGHGHRTGRQLLIRISGEIEVEVSWDGESRTVILDAVSNAILISAPVWSRQFYRGKAPSLLVLCDTLYDPESYVFDRT